MFDGGALTDRALETEMRKFVESELRVGTRRLCTHVHITLMEHGYKQCIFIHADLGISREVIIDSSRRSFIQPGDHHIRVQHPRNGFITADSKGHVLSRPDTATQPHEGSVIGSVQCPGDLQV